MTSLVVKSDIKEYMFINRGGTLSRKVTPKSSIIIVLKHVACVTLRDKVSPWIMELLYPLAYQFISKVIWVLAFVYKTYTIITF